MAKDAAVDWHTGLGTEGARVRRRSGRWRCSVLGSLACLVGAAACGAEPEPAEDPAAQEAQERADALERTLVPAVVLEGETVPTYTLQERMAHHDVPAVSVAVIENGALSWARAYGVADIESGRAATTRTVFQAASISKPVAATAVLTLVERGVLELDGNVNDQLASWSVPDHAFDGQVTLRGLLTHTSGLGVSGFPGYARGETVPSAAQVVAGGDPVNTDPVTVVAEPGSEWSYSGGGYTVMQVLVEDMTDQPFADFVQDRVLQPLGMDRSTYAQPLPDGWWDDAAWGHRNDGSRIPGRFHTYPELAAAGLWTTPTDLATWAIEIQASSEDRSNRVLQTATVQEMLARGMGDWGLGPSVNDDDVRFGHTGSNQGYRCLLTMATDGSLGLVVMTNSDNGSALMREIALGFARVYGWETTGVEPQVRTEIPVDPTRLDDYVGQYQIPDGRTATVARDGDQLTVQAPWFRLQRLYGSGEDAFFLLTDGTDIRFVREDGQVQVLRVFDRDFVRVQGEG